MKSQWIFAVDASVAERFGRAAGIGGFEPEAGGAAR